MKKNFRGTLNIGTNTTRDKVKLSTIRKLKCNNIIYQNRQNKWN